MPDKSFIIYKVTPKDMEKLNETEAEIKGIKTGKVKDIKREEIGFGIVILKVGVLVNEKEENAMEKATQELENLPLLDRVEQESMTLL